MTTPDLSHVWVSVNNTSAETRQQVPSLRTPPPLLRPPPAASAFVFALDKPLDKASFARFRRENVKQGKPGVVIAFITDDTTIALAIAYGAKTTRVDACQAVNLALPSSRAIAFRPRGRFPKVDVSHDEHISAYDGHTGPLWEITTRSADAKFITVRTMTGVVCRFMLKDVLVSP